MKNLVLGLFVGMTACAVNPVDQREPIEQEGQISAGEQPTPRGEALDRQEPAVELEATTSCTISQDRNGQIIFTPDTLQVNPGDFVQFTATNVTGSLTVPADIFGDAGPWTIAPNTPAASVKIQVLPTLQPNTSGTARFASSIPLVITGTITIGTGPGLAPPHLGVERATIGR